MDLGLGKERVVITGGSSGIGWACVKQFLEEGSKVAIWDIRLPSESQLAEIGPGRIERLYACQVDVTDDASLKKAFDSTLAIEPAIDHVVHAAAIGSGKFGFPFTNLEPNDWLKTLDVNIMGTVRLCHTVAPWMRDRGHGSLCIIGSIAGQIGSQTDPPYSASKAANINFAQCLAKDLAPFGVRVNVINPGMVQTPLNRSVWQAWHDAQPVDQRQSYEVWAGEKIRKVIPLGRWQTVEDIANMVVFLASGRARNVTGQCINVDGGFVMHS